MKSIRDTEPEVGRKETRMLPVWFLVVSGGVWFFFGLMPALLTFGILTALIVMWTCVYVSEWIRWDYSEGTKQRGS